MHRRHFTFTFSLISLPEPFLLSETSAYLVVASLVVLALVALEVGVEVVVFAVVLLLVAVVVELLVVVVLLLVVDVLEALRRTRQEQGIYTS